MIDPKSGIASEGIPQILPKRINAFARIKLADGINTTLVGKTPIGGAHFWPKEGIIPPALRSINVKVRRNDVVVAGENCRHPAIQHTCRMENEPVEPSELVVE